MSSPEAFVDLPWRGRPVPVQAETFVLQAVTVAIQGVVLAGACCWLATVVHPLFWAIAFASAVVSMRSFFLVARGGVTIDATSVTIRTTFRTQVLDRRAVERIVEMLDRWLRPTGYLWLAGTGWVRLSGATALHRHGLGARSRCETCVNDARNLRHIARSLDLDLAEASTEERAALLRRWPRSRA